MKTLSNTDAKAPRGSLRWFFRPARPEPWIVAWGIYSLVALGYFGYYGAWLGALCGVIR